MALPNEASLFPPSAESRLTISSGIEVPKATTVRPMAKLEIPYFLAADDAPLTRKSAPFIKIPNPSSKSKIGINIGVGFR
jgi:hypothetical protein